jgi:hypothetical protein
MKFLSNIRREIVSWLPTYIMVPLIASVGFFIFYELFIGVKFASSVEFFSRAGGVYLAIAIAFIVAFGIRVVVDADGSRSVFASTLIHAIQLLSLLLSAGAGFTDYLPPIIASLVVGGISGLLFAAVFRQEERFRSKKSSSQREEKR